MLSRLSVRNFQSLRSVDLDLGRLTVITGPSDSGKSALLRAIRMVATNISSPRDVVSHGATTTSAEIGLEDGSQVGIIRGRSKSEYLIGDRLYAKSGVAVPEPVREILRFAEVEGEDLNFAFQHDRPFLLDVPSTTTAKVLGDLTNVNRIFGAVREANRRRLEVTNRLKVRRTDVERLTEEAERFRRVPAEKRAVTRASLHRDNARTAQERAEGVSALIKVVEIADQLRAQLVAMPPIPDIDVDGLMERSDKVGTLRELIGSIEQSAKDVLFSRSDVERIGQELATVDNEYHAMLKEMGTCPFCGTKIKK